MVRRKKKVGRKPLDKGRTVRQVPVGLCRESERVAKLIQRRYKASSRSEAIRMALIAVGRILADKKPLKLSR